MFSLAFLRKRKRYAVTNGKEIKMEHRKKKKILDIISWGIVIGLMGMIFYFSSQVGEESSELSGTVSYDLMNFIGKVFHTGWSFEQVNEHALQIEYFVRKVAHFSEYGVLGLAILLALYRTTPLRGWKLWGACVCIACLYAASDEIHQLFVPGRSGRVFDVCVDTCGSMTFTVIAKLWKKY